MKYWLIENFNLLTALLRESMPAETLPRDLSSLKSLKAADILAAAENGGSIDGPNAAGYLYQSARISRVIDGCRTCVDLGCGVGVQLIQLAQLNPTIQFIGVDRDAKLLEHACQQAKKLDLKNIDWIEDNMIRAKKIESLNIGAVISCMSLNMLEDPSELKQFFYHAQNLVGAKGALYFEDFARLKSQKSVEFFIHMSGLTETDPHTALFRAGLNAAYSVDELKEAATALHEAAFFSTFLAPLLVVIKTADRQLRPDVKDRLLQLRDQLSPDSKHRLKALDDFFKMGGLKGDPFR